MRFYVIVGLRPANVATLQSVGVARHEGVPRFAVHFDRDRFVAQAAFLATTTARCRWNSVVGLAVREWLMAKAAQLIAIMTFPSTADAQVAKGILDEVGIESMIRADNAGGMYPAISGAELLVRSEDVERADEALHRRHRRST